MDLSRILPRLPIRGVTTAGGTTADGNKLIKTDATGFLNTSVLPAVLPITGVAGNFNVGGNLTVVGDLTVSGATVTLDTTNLTIEDTTILLSKGALVGADGGFLVERGSTGGDATLMWTESLTRWQVGVVGSPLQTIAYLSELTDHISDTAANFATVDTQITALGNEISAVEGDIVGLDTRMSSVESEVITLDGRLDDVDVTLVGYEASINDLIAHTANTDNPHSVTKAQVGLGNVTNDQQLTIGNNLGDIENTSGARDNLGLGSAAVEDVDAFAAAYNTVPTVADQAARLALTPTDVGYRVKQADLSNVIWFYEGGSAAVNTNWRPYVITDPNGDLLADLVLPETQGIVPGDGVLGRFNNHLVIGDGTTLNGNLANVVYRNDTVAFIDFVLPGGGNVINVTIGTVGLENYKLYYWDNTFSASQTSDVGLSPVVAANYLPVVKRIQAFSTTPGLQLTKVGCEGVWYPTAFDGGNNPLEYISLSYGNLPFVDISRYASTLTTFTATGTSQDVVFGLERCSMLSSLGLGGTTVDLTRLPQITNLALLWLGSTVTTFIPTLQLSLATLNLEETQLATLDVSLFPNLSGIFNLDNCPFALDATACDAFFTSLPDRTATSTGLIFMNVGSPAGDVGIATAKNWAVSGV